MDLCTILLPFILLLKLLIYNVKSHDTVEKPISWCPSGWREFENRCYNIYTNEIDGVFDRNFEEAQRFCQSNGGGLVIIHSLEEQNFLTAYLVATSPKIPVWIGLRKSEPWMPNSDPRWIDGSNEVNFRNYGHGQPDGGFDESCFVMDNEVKSLGQWKDKQCSDKNGFVCQRESIKAEAYNGWCPKGFMRYRDSCYRLEATKVDFWSAERECKTKYDSGLVSIKDNHEEAFMVKLASNLREKVWMGFSNHNDKQGDFDWTDAKHIHHYKRFEGPLRGTADRCVAAAPDRQEWTVEDCSKKNSFVCVKRLTKTENELKVEVRECPEGWLDINNKYCYYIESEQHKTVTESKIECAKKTPKGELAMLETPDVIVELKPTLSKYENKTFLMQVSESFEGESKLEVMEHCVEFNTSTLEYTQGCLEKRNYICQIAKGTGNTADNKKTLGVTKNRSKINKHTLTPEMLHIPEMPFNVSERGTTPLMQIGTHSHRTDANNGSTENGDLESNSGLSQEGVALIGVGLSIIALEVVAIGCIIYRRRCFFEHGH